MRLLIQHRSFYRYTTPALLGPHVLRLKPAQHARARIESYSLAIEPEAQVRWQQDPAGNHLARVTFRSGQKVPSLDVRVELQVDVRPVNPFDFFLDDSARHAPFEYSPALRHELAPYLDGPSGSAQLATGSRLHGFLAELPRDGDTVALVLALNQAVNQRVRYVIREEAGVWTPEETLEYGRGSCRDSATLLVSVLRSRGLAARFVSGYLVQLADEGMIPDQPRGIGRDVVDLHAWAEVYLPGGGWIGLDATSGLMCGEGHIPLACAATPQLAAPLEGTSSESTHEVLFEMTLGRIGHEPRPTKPFPPEVWDALIASGEQADERLSEAGLTLTMGGEPTFNARENAEAPEWNSAALGAHKWELGRKLANELRARLAPGAATLLRMGKLYPGESLPRWTLELIGARDGKSLWSDSPSGVKTRAGTPEARVFAEDLARRLALADWLMPAYEDPWRFLQDEAQLPTDTDPLRAELKDPEERRRLARVLDRGLAEEAGYVLPIARAGSEWASSRWEFRRGRLYLIPGDSPIGLRLPLRSLGPGLPPPSWWEPEYDPRDPRRAEDESSQSKRDVDAGEGGRASVSQQGVRTALCVEAREGMLYVFLPPLGTAEDFVSLVSAVDATRAATGLDAQLEGYPPAPSTALQRFSLAPDPGVLEVNIPPTDSTRGYVNVMEQVFDAALHSGLHAEKYMLDGRQAGSGGGHHLTMGGPSPLASPFLARPDMLASLLTFIQHHPSLSFMFTGLFVGPTSQAPRVDEARHDALYELEIAMERAFAGGAETPPPWLTDLLFRHLLTDLAGNTHRAEVCIDKLFDPATPHGRQGLVELRAFEMPPHPQMAVAQMLLVRSLVASFARERYQHPLVRWGQTLHDRFLLPYWMWEDFTDVLAHLRAQGLDLPEDAYRPFVELRCPRAGVLQAGDVTLSVHNAIEPWHVLGEELTAHGTSRYVDSSMERIEVRVDGYVPERHAVMVNGQALPLRPTKTAGRFVAGVRFRAWAPPHSLHAHLGIHHPIKLDVLDTWGKRSLGGCAYHVWHPEGRAFDTPPLTRFEAEARRAARFTVETNAQFPARARVVNPAFEAPYTLDLRRFPIDRPMPDADVEQGER